MEELNQALSHPNQKPVAWLYTDAKGREYLVATNTKPYEDAQPLYAAPPRREWVGLTDDELDKLYVDHHDGLGYSLSCYGYERAIEAALRSKNT